jgi:hypothetical protein
MKLYTVLQFVSFLAVFIGAYYGISEISKNNVEDGINKFIQIGVMPLLFIGFLRHTLLSGNIIKSHPFFEVEAGGANLGIFVSLLAGYLLKIPVISMVCILMSLLVYLVVGLIAHVYYFKKIKFVNVAKFVSINSLLIYFIYKGIEM